MTTYVYGAGGHGKVVCDILEAAGVQVAGFIDGNPKSPAHFGKPVLAEADLSRLMPCQLVLAVGANFVRQSLAERLKKDFPNLQFATAIHPSASVAKTATIGEGSVIAAGAVIGADAQVGRHCVINTGAQVDHDCRIEDYVSLAPGAVLGGSVQVGHASYLALGCKVIHGMKIGVHTVVGAGSVVVKPIGDYVLGYGHPFAVVRQRNERDPYL